MSEIRYDLRPRHSSIDAPVRRTDEEKRSPKKRQEQGEDPYALGWRYREVRTADGREELRLVPLTPKDLIDPQLDDCVPQSSLHQQVVERFTGLLRQRYAAELSVAVFSDLKLLIRIPGLTTGPSPDVCVLRGVLNRDENRTSFRWHQEPGEPLLAIEVVSPNYPVKDYRYNKAIYSRAGFPCYVIVDPRGKTLAGRYRIQVFELTAGRRYKEVAVDRAGRFTLESVGLYLLQKPAPEGLVLLDAATGERLLTGAERAESEAEARRIAEERAAAEAEARRAAEERAATETTARLAAEACLAEERQARQALERELARLRRSSGS